LTNLNSIESNQINMFFLLVWFKFRMKILQKNEPTIFSKSQTKPTNCNLSQTTFNYSFYIYDYNDKLNFTEMFDVHHYECILLER
jgi:hypothetical protein